MPATTAAPRTELAGVDRGLQRASGLGISAFAAQAVAVVVAGWPLYPAWWYVGPGPVMAATAAVTVVGCLRGRSRRPGRIAAIMALSLGCVTTAVATADTVAAVGSAVSPLVTAFAIFVGLFEPPVVALPAGALLISSQLVSVAVTRSLPVSDVLTVAAIQAAVLLSGAATRRIMRRSAVELDAARDRLTRSLAEDRVAAETRRDRREQERRLHDTVLSTLTALARSSLVESDRLRQRCAADARYLRTLQQRADDGAGVGADLVESLRAVARDRIRSGFRVEVVVVPGAAGSSLPDRVVDALSRAAGEAVANAARHSGAGAAEIIVDHRDGGVTVEVVDRGRGDIPLAMDGLGIRRSIVERMADAGGRARVHHAPGEGTRVNLTWPG